SLNPDDRYLDGTAFWLALREHLPAPDAARQALSRLALRALKLELTTDIRDRPPYLAPVLGFDGEARPGRALSLDGDALEPEPPVRYSLRPERSSRHSQPVPARSDDPAFALSDPPPPRSSRLVVSGAPSVGSLLPEPRRSW